MIGEETRLEIHLRKENDSYFTSEKWVAYDKNPDEFKGESFYRESGASKEEAVYKLLKSMGRIFVLEWTQEK